jgi:hypothetical protein
MSEWQPIETAPKDGKDILILADGGECFVVYWNEGRWQFASYGKLRMCVGIANYWMPLPEPPKD